MAGPASDPRPLARGPGCLITAGLLTTAPVSALACPVCGFIGTSDNTWAYQAMSAMLTLLPLAMVGAIIWWLARLADAKAADPKGPRRTGLPLSEGQVRRGGSVDG